VPLTCFCKDSEANFVFVHSTVVTGHFTPVWELIRSCCGNEETLVNRVDRLALSMLSSRNLAFLKVDWHEKMLCAIYVIISQVFGHF